MAKPGMRDYLRTARAMRTGYKLYRSVGSARPHGLLAKVRRIAPAIYVPDHTFVFPRYAEAAAILRDHERFSSDQRNRVLRPSFDAAKMEEFNRQHSGPRLRNTMLFADGADHERLRGLTGKAFTPRMIEGMRPRIKQLAHELLDAIEPRGSADLISDFAYPLPVTIICELLGVPAGDQHLFREWTAKAARSLDPSMNAVDQEEIVRAGDEAADAFGGYIADLIEQRRRAPSDDLLSALNQAPEGGDRLSTDELTATALLLLVAGHETTTNLIGSGTFSLLNDQLALEQLRSDLSAERMKVAVEELLRYEPPVSAVLRVALTDVRIGGTTVPAGYDVIPMIASANRDPAQFPEPDRLDVDRANNRHLTFSAGPHFCLGAPLARLEGQIAIAALLERFPKLRLGPGEAVWRQTMTLRSLSTLPVSF